MCFSEGEGGEVDAGGAVLIFCSLSRGEGEAEQIARRQRVCEYEAGGGKKGRGRI